MQLLAFFEESGYATVGDFTAQNVNLFRVHLRSRKLSENTIANRLRSIKAFARWMDKAGWADGNRLDDLRVPQSTKPQFELDAGPRNPALQHVAQGDHDPREIGGDGPLHLPSSAPLRIGLWARQSAA